MNTGPGEEGGAMILLDLFLVVLLLAILIPIVRQRMIVAARLRLFHKLEQQRGTRVIALIHRQESMFFLGFPVARYIDIQDSEEVLRAIQLTDAKVPIDIILHTPGGLVLAAEQIAYALSKRDSKVTVFVPHYAMSGGTMLAMAADEIIMDRNAVLGPVDPQVGQFPAASILNVLKAKKADKIDDETMILADISRKAIQQVKETIRRIACCHYTPEQAEKLADELASGRWTHDYPITIDEARQLGLLVNTEMPAEIYQIMNLYPQANTRRPSVEYIPIPYPTRPRIPERGDHKP